MPKLIEVIENLETEGKGTDESPCRLVTRYYTLDGKFLAERDEWLDRQMAFKTDSVETK